MPNPRPPQTPEAIQTVIERGTDWQSTPQTPEEIFTITEQDEPMIEAHRLMAQRHKPMNDTLCPNLKRGWPGQRQRREAECDVRRQAVAFDGWAGGLGLGHGEAAERLGIAPGTLASWEHRWREDGLAARPLGRPCDRGDPLARNEAIGMMRCVGPGISVAAVQAAFPTLARREVQSLHARFRWHCRQDNQRLLHVLHWRQPGAVWAMDHAEPPLGIDGRWPYVLAVRDLATGCQLAWLPVLDESAKSTIGVLQGLFLEYGPPLVLKSDNGPGFVADATRRFLDSWQVLPLYSPPYTPEYNGAIEAGNGALKTLTHDHAAREGRGRPVDRRGPRSGTTHGQRTSLSLGPAAADAAGRLPRPSPTPPAPPSAASSSASEPGLASNKDTLRKPPWAWRPRAQSTVWQSAVLSSSTASLPLPGGQLLHNLILKSR